MACLLLNLEIILVIVLFLLGLVVVVLPVVVGDDDARALLLIIIIAPLGSCLMLLLHLLQQITVNIMLSSCCSCDCPAGRHSSVHFFLFNHLLFARSLWLLGSRRSLLVVVSFCAYF